MTAITELTDLSKLPNQSQDQAVFDANFAYLIERLPARAAQENALVANLNAIAAGGAYAISYVLDTTTTADGDPGPGKMRFNQYSNQLSSTALFVDLTNLGGTDVAGQLVQFGESTSLVKGSLRLVKQGDPSKFLVFNVMALFVPSGYRTVSVVGVGGSSQSPFANGDAVMLYFQRTGDAGTFPGATERIGNPLDVAAGTSLINFRNSFNAAKYRKYIVEIENLVHTTQLMLNAAVGGAAVSGGGYTFGDINTATTDTTGASIFLTSTGSGITTGTLEFRGAHYTGDKSIGYRGYSLGSSSSRRLIAREGTLLDPGSLSGFQLSLQNGGVFSGGRITLWGVT